ncbi:hypothetical protein PD5205_00062 [Xanthomonas fragariae]|uniref:Uncharacterized protein n=1 Tax=Xanthomonas fragariae TaxID=48664 RepID=A0A1Y6HDY9_9XANT|nr:hypothetical protein PD885_00061 [Xanthomonas fragariae]SMR01386.1 hypothetical protein PD5205_00062 [Xanthomonas fragariae]
MSSGVGTGDRRPGTRNALTGRAVEPLLHLLSRIPGLRSPIPTLEGITAPESSR